jgi:hypothetical protein
MKKLIAVLFVCSITCGIHAQVEKNTTTVEQIWLAYFNQTRFTNRWGMWADLHLRTKEDFVKDLSQSILRVGLTYYLNDATKLTAGYAFVNNFPGDNHKNISQPENRLWQQVQWHTKYKKVRTMQWLRLEERWRHKVLNNDELADGYSYSWRVRYNFFYQAPLSKKGLVANTFSFVLNDEIFVNFGKQIVYNYFDQNRFFIGVAYQTNATDNLQFGYLNVFQQLAAGNQYKSINAARISYFHNLDLRKHK